MNSKYHCSRNTSKPVEISVIIPSYNRSALIRRALDSVLRQSIAANEILVVDDGSEDDTVRVVEQHYPSVCVIKIEHGGVSRARNAGIRHCHGNWIAFLDSDDEWQPDKLARQVERIATRPGTKLVHTDEIWIRNGRRIYPRKKHRKTGGYIFRNCLPLCCISPSSVLMKRSVFDEIGLFDETLPACEDYDLWLRLCARYPVEYIDRQLLTKYGGHADQLSRHYWGMDRFRVQALGNILDTGVLDTDDRAAVLETLIHKLGILRQGAEKHGNTRLYNDCHALLNRYQYDHTIMQHRLHA
ncbi:MAG: glycosyltransferase [Thiotrichales bacterium]|nr:glycosyltransferase [Thiotrichales bacterium]